MKKYTPYLPDDVCLRDLFNYISKGGEVAGIAREALEKRSGE